MDNPTQYDSLHQLVTNPDWRAVEDTLESYLTEMFDIRRLNKDLSAEDFKIECLSKLMAAENVYNFYKDNKFISKELRDIPFSFK